MSDEREPSSEVSRRRFLTVLGTTSAGAAVLSGCSTEKVEKLIPYLVQSEDQVRHSDLVREHLHRVQCRMWPARARARRPSGEARGQPENPINKGALCARSGRAAAYNPGGCAPRW
jgi:anaerobic selenocysteine-containing dehydrogenase